MKTFAKKMSEKFYFQILGYFGTIRTVAENGALNQNFGPTTFFALLRRIHTEKTKTLPEKLKEKFYFQILGHFGP